MNCCQSLSFGIAMIAWVAVGAASENVTSPAQNLTSQQILKFLGDGKEEKDTWRLTRHWVGTLKVVDSSPLYQNHERESKDEPVRFNVFSSEMKMGIGAIRKGYPTLAAMGPHGFSKFACYRQDLPTIADLRNRGKIAATLESFGEQHGFTDGWGGPDERMHWTEDWRWFTPDGADHLRVLTVFVHVSQARGKPKMIDEWIFREGRFRASDVADPADATAFPSEEEREAKRQAEIDAKDDALPEPLRSSMKARHHPGDSDLKSWFSVVRGFREHPDAVLLQQMIARLDDGTCEMSGMLNTLFQVHSFDKEIGAWNPRQRQQTRSFLLDALPCANNSHSLEDAAMLALRETGVCSVNIDTEELWSKMSSRYTKDGTTATFGLTLKSCHAARAGEILRDDIRRRWNPSLLD
jgi:hypothetical protein